MSTDNIVTNIYFGLFISASIDMQYKVTYEKHIDNYYKPLTFKWKVDSNL